MFICNETHLTFDNYNGKRLSLLVVGDLEVNSTYYFRSCALKK
jgi:hypothetical protein